MATQEQLEVRALAREFAKGEIRPQAEAWDAERALDPTILAKVAELGFMGMLIPERYQGLDLDLVTYLTALEEISWGDASVALSVAIQNGPVAGLLLRRGAEEQRERWLPELAAGEVLGAFALSEPEAGSDASSLETRAESVQGGWRLSGTKRWVTNGDRADLVVVFARTRPDSQGADGVGAFLVDRGADGYRVGRRERTLGLRASETVEVHLDGVRVPDEAVVGDPTRGFQYAMESVILGRIGVAAQALGIAQAAYEHAAEYAVEREQFGRAIADFGAIREKVAGMATRIHGARALTHQAGGELQRLREEGRVRGNGFPSPNALAAMAKLTASEAAMWVADEAVQIFGGYGYMRDYPAEKLMRDAKGPEIYEGTNEIMRHVIAREAIREVKEARGG